MAFLVNVFKTKMSSANIPRKIYKHIVNAIYYINHHLNQGADLQQIYCLTNYFIINLTPVRNILRVFYLAIENILSVGLIICGEEENYYFDEIIMEFIKENGGNRLKRKWDGVYVDDENAKKFRLNFSNEDDEQGNSSEDEEVFFYCPLKAL